MSELVNVQVPEEHLLSVYRFLGELESGQGSQPKEDSEAKGAADVVSGWTKERVRKFVTGGNSSRLHDALIIVAEAGDEGITTDELGDALQYERGAQAVAGMLGAAHRRARNKLGMKEPLWQKEWEPFDPGPGGTSRLTMEPHIREWVLETA